MIIERISAKPFAGLASFEMDFEAGLNVVLGPNEAGKSTLFSALGSVLFKPARLGKDAFQKLMQKYIPVGGDTAAVELMFRTGPDRYRLAKSWGSTVLARLEKPDGSVITDEASIKDAVSGLLPASTAAFAHVLMALQGSVGATIDTLIDKKDAMQDLRDILRRTVLASDGVSVDRFMQRVDDEVSASFSNWDDQPGVPARKHGGSGRWLKDVGLILKAWYDLEDARRALDEARKSEAKILEISTELESSRKQAAQFRAYVDAHMIARRDIDRRHAKVNELTSVTFQLDEQRKVADMWPVTRHKLEEAEGALPALMKQFADLTERLNQARAEDGRRELRERYARCAALKEKLDSALKAEAMVPAVTAGDMKSVRECVREIERVESGIAGGRLNVEVRALRDVRVDVERDFDPLESKEIPAADIVAVEASGRVRVSDGYMEITVTSGEGDFQELVRKREAAVSDLAAHLLRLKAADAATLESMYEASENAHRAVENSLEALNAELKGESFPDLVFRINSLPVVSETASTADITAVHSAVKHSVETKKSAIEELRKALNELEKKYGSHDALFKTIVDTGVRIAGLQKEIDATARPPEGMASDKFAQEFDAAESALKLLDERIHTLELNMVQLESAMPDEPVGVLSEKAEAALAAFERERRHGQALRRVQEKAADICRDMDGGTDNAFERDIAQRVAALTGNRYKRLSMHERIPRAVLRDDGAELPVDVLSAGTRDVLGLAVRLAMAGHFLGGADGFVVLDDPLVDLDPARQEQAAGMIREFAAGKQVIVFTCHPRHAEMLGGSVREMKNY
jgi:exonuclease SbcC